MCGNDLGGLVPLPTGICREVDYIRLSKIIRGSDLDPVALIIAYSPSCEVDWTWVEPARRWYQ